MFARAAKTLVKSISQRKYHAGEENIKLAMFGGVGEIGRSLSQMLKQSSKLDVLALYDVAATNKRLSMPFKPRGFTDGDIVQPRNPRMLTMLEKTQTKKGDYQTEEFVDSLNRLPVAEGCSKSNAPQGDNGIASGSDGPRVLAEMGPASLRRHGGRIVSEIYKQLPDFATYLGNNHRCNTNNSTLRRRYSNIALFSNERLTSIGSELQFGKPLPDFLVCPEKSSKRNAPADRNNRRCHAKKKDAKKLNVPVQEQIVEAKPSKLSENRPMIAQKINANKKKKPRRLYESKLVEDEINVERPATSNFSKSKNWTIPAALSDKKPKMLYGLVHQRKRPLTNFFARFFDILDKEAIDDRRGRNYGNFKVDRMNCAQKQKLFAELNERDRPSKSTKNEETRLNASTSTGDLAPESRLTHHDGSSNSLLQTKNAISVEKFSGSGSESAEERTLTSSNDESENDALSEIIEPRAPVQKMSTKIALFLENLRINRRKSSSLSSFPSYNLDTLFDQETTSLSDTVVESDSLLLSSSDSDSFASKICKKICGKMKRSKDDVCKKRKSSCQQDEKECRRAGKSCRKKDCAKEKRQAACPEAPTRRSCGQRKKRDDCEKEKLRASCGDGEARSCGRKKKEPPGCKKEDKGSCRSGCGTEDPCDPCRNKEHGPPCKKYQEDETYGKKDDSCKKYRRADIHGELCKEESEDPCKKLRTPDIHGKPCKTLTDGTLKGDTCCQYWKDEIHGSRCDKGKKKAAPESCSERKEEKQGDLKKKKQALKKKKAETTEKAEKEKCPPVLRAPSCGKSRGGGDDSSGQK